VAWTPDLPLEDVKRIKTAFGVTVNDVLMAVVAGGLRRYLLARGKRVPKSLNIRAMVPVNLRPLSEATKLGNSFGLVVMSLPLGIHSPLDRVMEVKRRMDDLKNSPEAVVGYTLLEIMGMTPAQIENLLVQFFAMKSTLVLTNVPGPQQPLYFAGSPIERIMFWVPQSGRLGMGVSIFSYAGMVNIGVMTDYRLVPDPEAISDYMMQDFNEMLAMTEEIQAQAYEATALQAEVEAEGSEDEELEKAAESVAAADEVNEAAPEPDDEEATSDDDRCIAITKEGTRCKNKALPGSRYCRVHAHLAAEPD
jgi:WS/DGAT/MGAT family acyltransferase